MKTFDYLINLPISAVVQDDEIQELERQLVEMKADRVRRGMSTSGLTLERIIMDRAVEEAVEALQYGAVQHEGKLFAVIGREPRS